MKQSFLLCYTLDLNRAMMGLNEPPGPILGSASLLDESGFHQYTGRLFTTDGRIGSGREDAQNAALMHNGYIHPDTLAGVEFYNRTGKPLPSLDEHFVDEFDPVGLLQAHEDRGVVLFRNYDLNGMISHPDHGHTNFGKFISGVMFGLADVGAKNTKFYENSIAQRFMIPAQYRHGGDD